MKDRRFKIGLVSMNIAASWGKHISDQIIDSIPEGSITLKTSEDFDTASLMVLIYHKDFGIVPDGKKIPKLVLDIEFNDQVLKPSSMAKPSGIILPH